MAININTIKATGLRAVGNRVLVTDMHFGEQKTASGLIINSDDGKERGIYPRWAKVYAKGPDNIDEYEIGQWILVEHGRWTRGMALDIEGEELEIRMVEAESILAYSTEKPDGVSIGNTTAHGTTMSVPNFAGA
jgi:co-chaperonin GroES (HSP10)